MLSAHPGSGQKQEEETEMQVGRINYEQYEV